MASGGGAGQDPEVGSDLATYFNTPKGGVG